MLNYGKLVPKIISKIPGLVYNFDKIWPQLLCLYFMKLPLTLRKSTIDKFVLFMKYLQCT